MVKVDQILLDGNPALQALWLQGELWGAPPPAITMEIFLGPQALEMQDHIEDVPRMLKSRLLKIKFAGAFLWGIASD